jgi:alpha-beta hydrolase superfamily lysophospholipase
MLEALVKDDTNARWGLQNGTWVNAVATAAEYVRSTADYTLTVEDIGKIQTPVLVLEGKDDRVFQGQAAKFAAALKGPHEHVVMRDADGAGEQAAGNMRRHRRRVSLQLLLSRS